MLAVAAWQAIARWFISKYQMKSLLLKISGSAALVLIFLAMFLPTAYVPIKAVFLVLMTGGVIASGVLGYVAWNKQTVIACFLLALVGLLNSLHGEIRGNLGATPMLTVMVIWPLVYCAASALLNNKQSFHLVMRTLFTSLSVIIIYALLYIGNKVGFVPAWAYIDLDMGQNINELFVEFALYHISSLTFLIPFAATYTYLARPESLKSKIFLFISLLICSVVVILSGRRALQIILLISPFITFFTVLILQSRVKLVEILGVMSYWMPKVLLLALVVIGAANILILDFAETVVSNFIYAYDIFDNDKESERTGQFYSLISGWISSGVLLGAGNGAFTEVIRSTEMPWAYELTFVYLLFSTGIVGVLFYFGWFGWGLIRVKQALHSRPDLLIFIAPFVSGVFGLSIASISNPYFGKFDYLWIILLPHLLAGAVKYQSIGITNKYVRTS